MGLRSSDRGSRRSRRLGRPHARGLSGDDALERRLDFAIQFAWGLIDAHAQGLVHQDVKPANVLATRDGTVKVPDFGIAQARAVAGGAGVASAPGHSMAVPGAGMMTIPYRSPEQALRRPLTSKTDVWSWALSVLEMFAGGRTWAVREAGREALEQHWASIPPEVAALLGECLSDDPSRRPALTEALRRLQEVNQARLGRAYERAAPEPVRVIADGHNNRALSLLDLGREAEAMAAWEEALTVDPRHLESRYSRGLHQWRRGASTGRRAACQRGGRRRGRAPSQVLRPGPGSRGTRGPRVRRKAEGGGPGRGRGGPGRSDTAVGLAAGGSDRR